MTPGDFATVKCPGRKRAQERFRNALRNGIDFLVVDNHLKRVQARVQVGNVHPLAVDVMPVNVGAVDRYALIAVIGAREYGLCAVRALVVLQAERRLVSFGHFHAAHVHHVERGEHLHAVIVPALPENSVVLGNGVRHGCRKQRSIIRTV